MTRSHRLSITRKHYWLQGLRRTEFCSVVGNMHKVLNVAVPREPNARILSAINMWYRVNRHQPPYPSSCDTLDNDGFDAFLSLTNKTQRVQRVSGDFLALRPYSEFLNVYSSAEVPRAIAVLRRDFIVGVQERLTEFFDVIFAAVTHHDAKAVTPTALHPDATHEHATSQPYCQAIDLSPDHRARLEALTGTDNEIYAGANAIAQAQHNTLSPRTLPVHDTAACCLHAAPSMCIGFEGGPSSTAFLHANFCTPSARTSYHECAYKAHRVLATMPNRNVCKFLYENYGQF